MLNKLFATIQRIFDEISIEVDIHSASAYSVQAELEVETACAIYSYRYERWFNASEVTPLETTWGDREAAITNDGIILLATECVWNDGYSVSDVEIPSPEIKTFPGFGKRDVNENRYEVCAGW